MCSQINSNKSGGLWITSSSDNYFSTSQFKVSFTNPFTSQQICFSEVCLNESTISKISVYVWYFVAVVLTSRFFFFGLIFGICNYLRPVYFSGVPVMKKKQCLLILLLCLITPPNEWGPVLERYFIGNTCACVCACVCSVFSSVPHLKPLILG